MTNRLFKLIIFLHLYFIHLLLADFSSNSSENSSFLLCKNCGKEVFSIQHIVYMKSPFALQTWNDTLLSHSSFLSLESKNDSELLATLQLLRNPHGSMFEIITVQHANLLLLNNTKSLQDTWFPNFMWIIGVCPHCFNHLGWFFESIKEERGFFALILDQLVGQDLAESLIITPKLKII